MAVARSRVVLRARGDGTACDLLGAAPSEEHAEAVLELLARQHVALVVGSCQREHRGSEIGSRDDRHAVHGIRVWHDSANERVPAS